MGGFIGQTPPLPPSIAQQGGPPPMPSGMGSPVPVVTGAGQVIQQNNAAQLVQLLKTKVVELEQWAGDMLNIVSVASPSLRALLIPIAKAGKAIQSEVAEMEQQLKGPQSVPLPTPNPDVGIPQGVTT